MANPFHHALSSAKKFGGKWEDYIAIHSWFDQTKSTQADPRHRMVLHHAAGIFMMEQQFGPAIQSSTGKMVPTRWVGEQHVEEDYGFIPSLARCWQSCVVPPPYDGGVSIPYEHAERSAQAFGGSLSDYLPVHLWMDQCRQYFNDPRADLILHNLFGMELAEQRFGQRIGTVYVRDIVSLHIHRDLGAGKAIPTLANCLSGLKKEMWMGRGARKLSEELDDVPTGN